MPIIIPKKYITDKSLDKHSIHITVEKCIINKGTNMRPERDQYRAKVIKTGYAWTI